MTNQHPNNRTDSTRSAHAQRTVAPVVACVALAIATIFAGVLLMHHWGGLSLPGCGEGGGCAEASRSAWAKVPGLNLPVAGIAASYFLGMLVWCGTLARVRPTPHAAWRTFFGVSLLGGAASLLYVLVMVFGKYFCSYCLLTHTANFAFVATAWVLTRGASPADNLHKARNKSAAPASPSHAPAQRAMFAGAAVGLIALVAMLGAETVFTKNAKKSAETALQQSLNTITNQQQGQQQGQHSGQQPAQQTQVTTHTQTQPSAQPTQSTFTPPTAAPQPSLAGLTGRYRRGPEFSPIRVVLFTDYQCPDCKKIEAQLEQVLANNPEVSASIRFFPFSTTCNPDVTENLHPDACFAAAAAYGAGQQGGTEAFWNMHRWLFSVGGSFTPQLLSEQAKLQGLDGAALLRTIDDPATFTDIRGDIALAGDLGIRYTPMIFINGVELKGFNAPDALTRAVATIAATKPPAQTSAADTPPTASERFLADWRAMPAREVPATLARHWLGAPDAKATVIVIGDRMEPGTFEADAVIRGLLQTPGANFRYSFVSFPVDQSCNASVPFTKFKNACLAARAAEAAVLTGNDTAFWRMHEWLMNNRDILSRELVEAGAPAIDLDANAIIATLDLQGVSDTINADAKASLALGIANIPAIYINGKRADNWKVRKQPLLDRMIREVGGLP